MVHFSNNFIYNLMAKTKEQKEVLRKPPSNNFMIQGNHRYKPQYFYRSTAKSVEYDEGEYLERKVERIVHNNEPITDGSPEIFTPLKDGVIPAYNIRTDRFEVAAEAMDAVSRSLDARRDKKASIGAADAEAKAIDGDTSSVAKGKSTEGSVNPDSSSK